MTAPPTLHDRLQDLARDAPRGTRDPDLWSRATRLHRVRRAGTAVIAAVAVLVLIAIAGASWQRSQPQLSPAGGTAALPDRIWTPSPWLPGTDGAGALGQVAALQYADRRTWTGTSYGVVAISAVTGDYRFLDLPDSSGDEVALSPDGRHVAYWIIGDTRLSPNSGSGPVAGVAVYDTTTGEVVRRSIPTDHGLEVDISRALTWADSDRLVLSYGEHLGGDADSDMDQSSSSRGPGLLVWKPSSDEQPELLRGVDGDVESSTGHGQLLIHGARKTIWVDLDMARRPKRFSAPGALGSSSTAVNDAGTLLAGPMGSRSPNDIAVMSIEGTRTADRRNVPGSGQTFAVRAWLDDDHVAADRRTGTDDQAASLYDVDVRTGESTELLRYPSSTYGRSTLLARDLLDVPTVTRAEPPRPYDPRLVATAGLITVAGGVLGLVLWRRRVRP